MLLKTERSGFLTSEHFGGWHLLFGHKEQQVVVGHLLDQMRRGPIERTAHLVRSACALMPSLMDIYHAFRLVFLELPSLDGLRNLAQLGNLIPSSSKMVRNLAGKAL